MKKQYKFALIGYGISYSRSGEVFEAIFETTGIPGTFEMFDIAPEEIGHRLTGLVQDGMQGLSVTIPYKRAVIEYLDEIDTIARALEAVNSVAVDSGVLRGFNTDCYGFSLPLHPYSQKLKHGRALIFGCGGVARAAVYSLYTDYEVRQFIVIGRTESKLLAFCESLQQRLHQIRIEPIVGTRFARPMQPGTGYDIIVNCTPVGGWNHPAENPLPTGLDWSVSGLYYDVNYNDNNRPVAEARAAGLTVIDGSAMLVGQAIRSFDIWTGQAVPFEPVFQRVFGRTRGLIS